MDNNFGSYGENPGIATSYGVEVPAIRVDMLHKLVIIAVGGKIGKPFLRVSATDRNRSELKTTHQVPTTPRLLK